MCRGRAARRRHRPDLAAHAFPDVGVLGEGDAHVHKGAGDHSERTEEEVHRLDLEFLDPITSPAGVRAARSRPRTSMAPAVSGVTEIRSWM